MTSSFLPSGEASFETPPAKKARVSPATSPENSGNRLIMIGPDGSMQEVDVSALFAGARLEAAKAELVPEAVEQSKGKDGEAQLLVGRANAASHSKDASDILVGSMSLHFQLNFSAYFS